MCSRRRALLGAGCPNEVTVMLNYLHAELYKALHRRYLYVFTGVLFLLEGLYALIWAGMHTFANMVGLLSASMLAGLFLTPMLVDVVFSDQYRQHTLKNEIAFGLSRTRIYLGKLGASLLVALMVCALAFALYLGVGFLFCAHPDTGEERAAFGILGYVVLASLPLWTGMLGMSVMLFFLIPNNTVAVTLLVAGIVLADFFVWILTAINVAPLNTIGSFLQGILLTSPFGQYHGVLTTRLMAHNWLLGLGWLLGSTAVGLAIFRCREIL